MTRNPSNEEAKQMTRQPIRNCDKTTIHELGKLMARKQMTRHKMITRDYTTHQGQNKW